jgi:outer membrane protein assembly factor BamB
MSGSGTWERARARRGRLAVVIGLFALAVGGPAMLTAARADTGVPPLPALPGGSTCTATNWPMFGHDPGRSLASPDTCITAAGAAALRPKWFANTSSPITAEPAVVDGVVYAGDFAGKFHAFKTSDGSEAWPAFDAHAYDNELNDFGAFADSPAVATVHGHKVVVVGGGATLFVLDAGSGARLASICLDRVDTTCQGKTGYTTEIESSPVVIPHGNGAADILVGTDVNEHDPSGPAGLYDITFDANGHTLTPKWMFDPETGATSVGLPPAQTNPGTEHGCGDVWSSPSIVAGADGNLAVFGVGNCNHPGEVHGSRVQLVESTIAVNVETGLLAWQATPHAPNNGLDFDFGATPNALPAASGAAVGEGGKDGVYYGYDSAGVLKWKTQVATGSDIGGMIASTAVGTLGALHGNHPAVFAATAIPVSTSDPQGSFTNDLTSPNQALGLHAVDLVTHQVAWDAPVGPAYGAAIFDNGLVFVPDTFTDSLLVLDADTGAILRAQPINAPPAGPAAISGADVYMGSGTTESGPPLDSLSGFGGLWAFTTTP